MKNKKRILFETFKNACLSLHSYIESLRESLDEVRAHLATAEEKIKEIEKLPLPISPQTAYTLRKLHETRDNLKNSIKIGEDEQRAHLIEAHEFLDNSGSIFK